MITELQKAVADLVKAKRKAHNEFQVDLGVAIDRGRTFVSDVENYRKAYNLEHLNKIAKHYNCRLHDLIPEYPID